MWGEVVALEEEWEGAGFGEGVGGAVAEVEGGGMAALAVAEEGMAGGVGEGSVLGDDLDGGAGDEGVESVQLAASPVWVARTMLVSRKLTAERRMVGAAAIAVRKGSASGSRRRMAMRAELSITRLWAVTWGGRGRRRGRRR